MQNAKGKEGTEVLRHEDGIEPDHWDASCTDTKHPLDFTISKRDGIESPINIVIMTEKNFSFTLLNGSSTLIRALPPVVVYHSMAKPICESFVKNLTRSHIAYRKCPNLLAEKIQPSYCKCHLDAEDMIELAAQLGT